MQCVCNRAKQGQLRLAVGQSPLRQVFLGVALVLSLSLPLAAVAVESTYADGVAAYKAGQYTQALTVFGTLHAQEPANTNVAYYLAITHAQVGNFQEAEALYQSIIRREPNGKAAALAKAGLGYLPDLKKQYQQTAQAAKLEARPNGQFPTDSPDFAYQTQTLTPVVLNEADLTPVDPQPVTVGASQGLEEDPVVRLRPAVIRGPNDKKPPAVGLQPAQTVPSYQAGSYHTALTAQSQVMLPSPESQPGFGVEHPAMALVDESEGPVYSTMPEDTDRAPVYQSLPQQSQGSTITTDYAPIQQQTQPQPAQVQQSGSNGIKQVLTAPKKWVQVWPFNKKATHTVPLNQQAVQQAATSVPQYQAGGQSIQQSDRYNTRQQAQQFIQQQGYSQPQQQPQGAQPSSQNATQQELAAMRQQMAQMQQMMMMMGMMNSANGGMGAMGMMNPMMNMGAMGGYGQPQNEGQTGGTNPMGMDPELMKTMMMNQMLQSFGNFNSSGGNNDH